jgi:hypothetical protein
LVLLASTDGWALGIAIAGVVLAVCSLGWQWWTCRYAGARVQVSVEPTMTHPAPHGQGGMVPSLAVRARNKGSSATQIVRWGLVLPDGTEFLDSLRPVLGHSSGPSAGNTLEGHHQLDFEMPAKGGVRSARQPVRGGS